jgi:hypothetical protein
MRGIAALCLCFLMACDAGVKGGLLRVVVDNSSDAVLSLEISSILEERTEVQSPISTYSIQAASQTTLLHGFPCRRYGRDAAMSEFTFQVKPNFHCSFRARPGCGEFPIHLSCGDEGCSLDNLPWPVQCE